MKDLRLGKINPFKNENFSKFFAYSFSSLLLFIVAFIVLNTLILIFKDKILAAKITFVVNFCNSFIYYCFFYKIKKRLSFFIFFVLNSSLFRFLEFNFLVLLINNEYDHNLGLFLVLLISHTFKYYYYLVLLKFFKFDII